MVDMMVMMKRMRVPHKRNILDASFSRTDIVKVERFSQGYAK